MSNLTCSDIFNCCDCGGNGCECAYCFSCRACPACEEDAGEPCTNGDYNC